MLDFGVNDYVLTPHELVYAIVQRLDAFEAENPEAQTGAWTLAVQDALKAAGEQAGKGIEHFCSRTSYGPGTGEFLLDGVWWRRATPGSVEHIALAVEFEFAGWAKNRKSVADEVAKDFEKLLVVKSPLKLMIFCSWYVKGDGDEALSQMREHIWNRLLQHIVQYSHHIEGEKYIFLDTAVRGKRKAWTFTVPRSGSLSRNDITQDHIAL